MKIDDIVTAYVQNVGMPRKNEDLINSSHKSASVTSNT